MERRTKRHLEFSDTQQCSLCNGHHTAPNQWKDDQARMYVLSLEVVSPGSQICRLCRDDVTKVLSKSTAYTPRWEKKNKIKTSTHKNATYVTVRMLHLYRVHWAQQRR